MANHDHVTMLVAGRDVWNRWRAANPDIIPDLSRASFLGINFGGYNLQDVILDGSTANSSIHAATPPPENLIELTIDDTVDQWIGMKGPSLGSQLIAANSSEEAGTLAKTLLDYGEPSSMPPSELVKAFSAGEKASSASVLAELARVNQMTNTPQDPLSKKAALSKAAPTIPFVVKSDIEKLKSEILVVIEEKTDKVAKGCEEAVKHVFSGIQHRVEEQLEALELSRQKLGELEAQQHVTSQRQEETLRAIDNVEKLLPKYAVGAEAENFDQLIKRHRDASWAWFFITGLLMFFTILAAYSDYNKTHSAVDFSGVSPPAWSTPAAISSRILIFALLSFAVVWASKNYRAEKHNENVYQHRAVALKTYSTVFLGGHSEETKDRLLVLAAEAMFRDRPTGYDGADKESKGGSVGDIFNVFKEVAKPDGIK